MRSVAGAAAPTMAASSSSLPPTAASLPGRLLAQAAQRPEACALEVWDEAEGSVQRLSFGELARLLRAAIVWHRRTGLRARGAFALTRASFRMALCA